VRRLFSNFAGGWPGVGLLLIRIVTGIFLITSGAEAHHVGRLAAADIPCLLVIGSGSLLILGLWTPIAGCLAIAVVAWEILAHHMSAYPGILLAALGAAVVLLGPGALSVDARLFGWKRIEL
jgi:uncharacterized membrane protein YphA (DoxX/SURF4 family)